jgi:hypothetical protein
MSIYQDIVFHCSRYVREKMLCLFIKTQLLIAQDAGGIGGQSAMEVTEAVCSFDF